MLLSKDITSHCLDLDKSTIFLPNYSEDEQSSPVSGRFHLTLARTTTFKSITVRVVGRLKTPRYGLFTPENREQVTFERTQPLACTAACNSFSLPSGDHEFPFAIPLSGKLFDTLTGPKHEYHSYQVEVVVVRWMRRDLLVSVPVGVYRVPRVGNWRGRDGQTTISGTPANTDTNTNTTNKDKDVAYHISIPDNIVPHGSTFPVECWFSIPRSKASTQYLNSLSVSVLETHDLCFHATAAESVKYCTNFITSHMRHTIFSEEMVFEREDCAADVQQRSISVRLPSTRNGCSQSYESKSIKIEHCVVVEVGFRDMRSGEVISVKETFPFFIYMKPDIVDGDEVVGREEVLVREDESSPPPTYGRHKLDHFVSVRAECETVA